MELLILDVDGVLTEGELTLIGEDLEAKRFNFHDGLGLILLKAAGIKTAIISDRQSAPLTRRLAELGIEEVAVVSGGDKEASFR